MAEFNGGSFGDTSMYTDPDFISKIAQLQDDPAALRALAMSPVDPEQAAAEAQRHQALWDSTKGYYSAAGGKGGPTMNPGVGQLLSGAATGVAGYRPPAPAVINPGHAPSVGGHAQGAPVGAPTPMRQPYHIGKLLVGR